MQTVFQIELHTGSESLKGKPFIPRKSHKKSRGGCFCCKQRRQRCDQNKPICGRCEKTGSECIYPGTPGSSPKAQAFENAISTIGPLTSDMYTMAVDAIESDLARLVFIKDDTLPTRQAVNTFRILQHFQAHTASTLGNAQTRAAFSTVVAKKSWDNAFLMHMVLAISSAHLKRLYVNSSTSESLQPYATAEATHWHAGLQKYRQALQQSSLAKEADSMSDFDATLATAILSIIFTFALDDEVPLDAYSSGDEEKLLNAIGPFASAAGYRGVTNVYDGNMAQTNWVQVMWDSDDVIGTFSSREVGVNGLPPAFVELCGLDENSSAENNEYHQILRLLTPLLTIEPIIDNFVKFASFSGRVWPFARSLLHKRDPRCLLLMSYWFAILVQLDQWWLTKRAKFECIAIVHYLSQLDDPEILALLEFPRSLGKSGLTEIWNPGAFDVEEVGIVNQHFGGL